MRFQGSKTVTFSGDTSYFPPLADFAAGSDLLIHEAMLPKGVDLIVSKTGLGDKLRAHIFNAHTAVEDVARIAAAAGVDKLALNHLIPADDPLFTETDWLAGVAAVWAGSVVVGCDGLEIEI